MYKVAKMDWAPDRPDVKIKNHGLGQYMVPNPFILYYHFGNFVH